MSDVDIPEADVEPGLAHPRRVYDLMGQAQSEASIAEAFGSGHMHHAWMITGPKGTGKATLAYRLARRALGAASVGEGLETDRNDPVCRQLEALSHPDFLLIRRGYNDKTKKLRGEISVDDTRKVSGFFAHSASGHHWRVCVVDSADEMNINAANALLKTLEEPPKRGLLILIVHTPGRLLPTIRSRCRRLALMPPSVEATASWLQTQHNITPDAAMNAASLAGGAPGRALSFIQNDFVELKPALDRALAGLPRLKASDVTPFATSAGKKGGEAFGDVLMEFLARYAEDRARDKAFEAQALDDSDRWVNAAQSISHLARESKAIYLDPKQTIYAAFDLLQEAASNKQ